MKNLIDSLYANIVKVNEGYQFLFRDDVYLPIYKNSLRITKRKVVRLNLVEEKVLQIVQAGIYQNDEISRVLGLSRRLLDVTIADLHTKDLISVTADACKLLKNGELALLNLARVEKSQDIMKDIHIDGLLGNVLQDVSGYIMIEKAWSDDNKLKTSVFSNDLKQIVTHFSDIREIFDRDYNQVELAEGIQSETQELLTIDKVESTYVTFIRIPLYVFASNNGTDIDVISAFDRQSELVSVYKDEIIRQINGKKVLRNHFKKKKIRDTYSCALYESAEGLYDSIKTMHFNRHKNSKDVKKLKASILSSRRLLDGEAECLVEYLASKSDTIELIVDSLDDWAYDRQFVGRLSGIIGKAKCTIIYCSSRNAETAIRKVKQGVGNIEKFEQCDRGYYICWKFDNKFELYGIPAERKAIDNNTCSVTLNYYLHKLGTKDI